MILADFHTHTTFCDGRNTPEEMARAALALGMTRLGFSEHAHTPFDVGSCMSPAGTEAYKKEVARLKEEYAGRMEIYCGVEQDAFSDLPTGDYDYVIGSNHYLHVGGRHRSVDGSEEELRETIEECFAGDPYALAEEYYRQEAEVVSRTGADIIGHFDLLVKLNERTGLFDEAHPRYVRAAEAALDALLQMGRPFELNTGAISRGYRTVPYPSPWLLRRLGERGGKVVLSSDSHRAETLCFGFEGARRMAEEAGVEVVDFRPRPPAL